MIELILEPRLEAEYSGNFRLRVPHSPHRKLADAAEAEGMSLNSYCNDVLAEAIGGVKKLLPKEPVKAARRWDGLPG